MFRHILLSFTCLITLCIASSAAAQLKVLSFDANRVPKTLKVKGKLKHGLRWLDRSGENYLLFSSLTREAKDLTSVYLYATHYLVKGDQVKQVRALKDREEQCEFNNMAAFDTQSFGVTDLDQDGMGEVTFIYYLELCDRNF